MLRCYFICSIVDRSILLLYRFVWSAAKILGTKNIITSPIWKGKPCQYQIFEGSINHNIRFLTDLNLSGCTWLEIPAGNHFRRKQDSSKTFDLKLIGNY